MSLFRKFFQPRTAPTGARVLTPRAEVELTPVGENGRGILKLGPALRALGVPSRMTGTVTARVDAAGYWAVDGPPVNGPPNAYSGLLRIGLFEGAISSVSVSAVNQSAPGSTVGALVTMVPIGTSTDVDVTLDPGDLPPVIFNGGKVAVELKTFAAQPFP